MAESQVLKDIYRTNSPVYVLDKIKKLNYKEASKKIQQASKHPLVKSLLYGKKFSLPNTIDDLRNGRKFPNSDNLEGELAWLVQSIIHFSEEINAFLDLEKEFQKMIILDRFIDAEKILNKIDSSICVSFWSLENRFSLIEKKDGTEKNWEFLELINKKIKSPYTLLFSPFYSKKSEIETTILQYKRDFEILLNNLSPDEGQYILFKLGYLYQKEYTELSSIVNNENLSSVIDRYILLLEVLVEISNIDIYRELLSLVIQDLENNNIKDQRIKRIIEFNAFDDRVIEDFNEDIMNMFDIYSRGEYETCYNNCIKLISQYPDSIEIYEILIRCILELDNDFKKTEISQTVDDILLNFYLLQRKDIDFYSARDNLLKIYILFPRLDFYKQILSLTNMLTESEHKKVVEGYYFAYSRFSNPQVLLYSNLQDKLKFREEDLEKYLAIKINYALAKDKLDILKNQNIPDFKMNVYKARIGYYHPEKADISFLKKILEQGDLKPYLIEEITICLFKAYLKDHKTDEIISLIVDSYFINRFLIERINTKQLATYIIESNYEIAEASIDLPLFFYIEKIDSYFLYATLEQYLNTQNIEKPSEMLLDSYDSKKIFLLSKVCSVDVLNNFYLIYESDDEVIEERIKILQKLAKIDDENNLFYLEEIAALTQKQKINKAIKTVNDGKISLNFSRIKADKEYNLETTFNRYLKLKEFSEKNDLSSVDPYELLKSYLTEFNTNTKSQDASYMSFKSLFFEIIDHFLYSKEHGLDGDLSTRIRHGVFENQIRSVFSNHKLIATKNSTENYNNITYWEDLCSENYLTGDINQKVQNAIKKFSKSVDKLITKIVEEYIQIQSNRHFTKSQAKFNYRFTEEFLYVLYQGFSEKVYDYDEFLNTIFEVITLSTQVLLSQISEIFKTQINQEFQELLSLLQEDLRVILKQTGEVWSEINLNIFKAQTEVERELYVVSEWFKISSYSTYPEIDIETIVKTAITALNFNSKDNKLRTEFTFNDNSLFVKGIYYIDIFKILFENAIKHSLLNLDELLIEIDVNNEILNNPIISKETDISKMTVKIKNNLCPLVDKQAIDNKLKLIETSWNNDLQLVNREGGSGFQKIQRILQYDIQVYGSSFRYMIEEDSLTVTLEIINPYTY
ncbi:hypothetical protein [Flavobacterium sp.]|uniref:hypothetical protein n=1 Tax=Flavobacterium sp. TaxID=239 RepID=UPI003A8DC839